MNEVILTLSVIIGLLVVALVVAIVTRPKVVTIVDEKPSNLANGVLKLQNEIRPYVYEKNGKVCLNVVKEK